MGFEVRKKAMLSLSATFSTEIAGKNKFWLESIRLGANKMVAKIRKVRETDAEAMVMYCVCS